MKNYSRLMLIIAIICFGNLRATNEIPADNPNIQYYGRWDFTNPQAPTHSWPGVYIYAEFEGTSIGIKTNDNFCFYNVIIDDSITSIFHGDKAGINSYSLKTGLPDGHHKILFTLRNELNWTKFAFNGFILDDGKNLLTPSARPEKKIEFVGNSYTCAAGNLWTGQDAAPSGDYTDEYEGFPSIVGRHYDVQYNVSGRSGYGMVQDYLGNKSGNLPNVFDRALVYTASPKWDFSKWIPNVVVICLGLNDYNGWNGYSLPVSDENSLVYRKKYHDFISTLEDVYPGVKILCVAANGVDWIKNNVSQVVNEENQMGNTNVYYTFFPYYGDAGYVNSGHPNVETHQKIADVIIQAIDAIDPWTPYKGTVAPDFVNLPKPLTLVTNSNYDLIIKTNKYATVKYSFDDKPYDQMENTFAVTGERVHSTIVPVENHKSYKLYLRAADIYGNKMDTSAVVQFSVDTTKVVYAWNQTGYDVSGWKKGNAPFGNDGASTNITNLNNTQTAYFKTTFSLTNVFLILNMTLSAQGHDGLVAYVNSNEVTRMNMETNKDINYDSFAITTGSFGSGMDIISVAKPFLHIGQNELEVEVHSALQANPNVSFDLQLANSNGTIYLPYGNEWNYYDAGQIPADQISNKPTDVKSDVHMLPLEIALYQNYPNPFNPTASITFDLNKRCMVQLRVFNALGQLVTIMENKELDAGNYHYSFNGTNLASGIYFYQLKADGYLKVAKMVLMK